MPNDEQRKNLNDSNGLERCPQGTDVGPFGRALKSFDNMTAGWIYAAAIEELLKRTEEIEKAIELIDPADLAKQLPSLEEDLADIDEKWILATALFGIDA
jgi:hypothetical protein